MNSKYDTKHESFRPLAEEAVLPSSASLQDVIKGNTTINTVQRYFPELQSPRRMPMEKLQHLY